MTRLETIREEALVRKFDGFRKSGKTTKPFPQVLLDYTDGKDLNAAAFACTKEGVLGIAIPYAAPLIIDITMLRLLSHPQVMPDVGDPGKELVGRQIFPLHTNIDKMTTLTRGHNLLFDDVLPKDKTRQEVAQCLGKIAMDFLIAHEFRHVQAGHVEWGATQFNRPNIITELKYGASAPSAMPGMKSQALEADADFFAIVQTLQSYFNDSRYPEEISPGWHLVMKNTSTVKFLVMFAVGVLFRLFGDDNPNFLDWRKHDHPPYRIRWRLVRNAASQLIDVMTPDGVDNSLEARMKELGAVEGAVAQITGEEWKVDGLNIANGQIGRDYIAELTKVWNEEVRLALQHYSYIDLSPPKNEKGPAVS
jgi:hypothetical protein